MFTRKVLKSAWLSSLPVLMGYLTMGFAAGVLFAGRIRVAAVGFWAFLTSATSISGALQFLMSDWAQKRTPLLDVALLTFCLNLRYAMYGFSLLERSTTRAPPSLRRPLLCMISMSPSVSL